MSFFPMLTELTIRASLLLNIQFPPMPRITRCEIEGGGESLGRATMDVFNQSPLETLSLRNMYIQELVDLPHTITSLSLIDIRGLTLYLAFFRFPNLRNLVVDFRGTEHFFSLSYEVHSGQPIVSTELIAYTLGTPLPLWLSRRIGKSCRNLGFIYFKGVLAKYSRDVSPFLRHFRERRRTSLIDQRAKTSWEALLSGRGGNHFIFFDETFYKGEIRDSGWQLRRSFQPPSTPGDITGLQIAENGDIYMTTFNEEERKEFDSSGFWTGSDSRVATSSKNAEFWELIRIDDWLRGS